MHKEGQNSKIDKNEAQGKRGLMAAGISALDCTRSHTCGWPLRPIINLS